MAQLAAAAIISCGTVRLTGWRSNPSSKTNANLIDYRAFHERVELVLIEGARFLKIGQIIAHRQDDRVKRSRAGAIKHHVPLLQQLQEADARQFTKQRKFVGVVGIKSGAVQVAASLTSWTEISEKSLCSSSLRRAPCNSCRVLRIRGSSFSQSL